MLNISISISPLDLVLAAFDPWGKKKGKGKERETLSTYETQFEFLKPYFFVL